MRQYFSHDLGARNDERCVELRIVHSLAGYGLYWCLIERLAESSDYMCIKDYRMLAFDLRCDTKLVKSVVEDFGLFSFAERNDGRECFYSESLMRRMQIKDEISVRRQNAANKRWSARDHSTPSSKNRCKCNANASTGTCKCNANASKKNAKKEIKEINKQRKGKKGEESQPATPENFNLESEGTPWPAELRERFDEFRENWNSMAGTLAEPGHVIPCGPVMEASQERMIYDFLANHDEDQVTAFLDHVHDSEFLRKRAKEGWKPKLFWAIERGDEIIYGNFVQSFDKQTGGRK